MKNVKFRGKRKSRGKIRGSKPYLCRPHHQTCYMHIRDLRRLRPILDYKTACTIATYRIGEIKSSVGRMCELTEVFWESVPKSWCSVGKGAVAELQRGSDWKAGNYNPT